MSTYASILAGSLKSPQCFLFETKLLGYPGFRMKCVLPMVWNQTQDLETSWKETTHLYINDEPGEVTGQSHRSGRVLITFQRSVFSGVDVVIGLGCHSRS